jgi:hypothetical protein
MTIIYYAAFEVSFLLATSRKVKGRKDSSGGLQKAVLVLSDA